MRPSPIKAPTGWNAPEEFRDYAEAPKLALAQVYWAWLKNRDLAVTIGGTPERICPKLH